MQFYDREIDKVIGDNLAALQKPGVISIRPGYQAAGHWLTKKPAIVVTVDRKRDDLAPQDRLPETVGGYAVDVREADAVQRLKLVNPTLYAHIVTAARPEMWRPTFGFERDAQGQSVAPPEDIVAALRAPARPKLNYSAPSGVSLAEVEDQMTITCHAGPDAAWPTLKPFLAGTQARLTVGMYDFTSTHVEQAMTAALADRKLTLVLDHPPKTRDREQSNKDTVGALRATAGIRLDFAWALEGKDPMVAAAIYPNAYHIKVIVRDGAAFWLSSGNLNTTNQPDFDPIANPNGASTIARKSDRDWHVIVAHRGLAMTYEKFLLNDFAVAAQYQAAGAALDLSDVVAELASPPLRISPRAPKQYFPAKVISANMRIRPVLTPDNYVETILPLINSAKKSFYMQTQYINLLDKPGNESLQSLVQAIVQKIQDGIDVRLIMSQYETLDKLETLQSAGVDLSRVKVQANVHNKGMIIDSSIAVVGSQNWSGDGVARNRDASLIIYNEEAAKYWEEIFIHDWTNMAEQRALD